MLLTFILLSSYLLIVWHHLSPTFDNVCEFVEFLHGLFTGGEKSIKSLQDTMDTIASRLNAAAVRQRKILTSSNRSAQHTAAMLTMMAKERMSRNVTPIKIGGKSSQNIHVRRTLARHGLMAAISLKNPSEHETIDLSSDDETNATDTKKSPKCSNNGCPHEEDTEEEEAWEQQENGRFIKTTYRKRKHHDDDDHGRDGGAAASCV